MEGDSILMHYMMGGKSNVSWMALFVVNDIRAILAYQGMLCTDCRRAKRG